MSTILIEGDARTNKLLQELAKKMGAKVKVLSDSKKEDLGLLSLMGEADRNKKVSKQTILKKLRS